MTMQNAIIAAIVTVVTLSNPVFAASPVEEAAHIAHEKYLAAINANDPVALLATVTDDIVFIAPNSPVMVGKAEVGPWVRSYFDAVETSWEKTSVEFVVAGNWAFQRYTYKSVDLPRGGGETHVDTGNGINIYRLGSDAVWRVARDAWASDGFMTTGVDMSDLATCTGTSWPC